MSYTLPLHSFGKLPRELLEDLSTTSDLATLYVGRRSDTHITEGQCRQGSDLEKYRLRVPANIFMSQRRRNTLNLARACYIAAASWHDGELCCCFQVSGEGVLVNPVRLKAPLSTTCFKSGEKTHIERARELWNDISRRRYVDQPKSGYTSVAQPVERVCINGGLMSNGLDRCR